MRYVPAWFPGAGFKRYAEEARLRTIEMREKPLNIVKQGMVQIEVVLLVVLCYVLSALLSGRWHLQAMSSVAHAIQFAGELRQSGGRTNHQ